jgi:hypothetical protein
MIQDLVIKIDENKQPLGNEVQSPPLLYENIKRVLSNVVLSDERAIPEEVEQHGYGVFEWAWAPEVPYSQTAESDGVTRHADGIYRPTFNVREATQSELDSRYEQASAEVRTARKYQLQRSDITQLPQATDEMKENAADWESYRQALRDITNQSGFPFNVQWPEKPHKLPR